MRLVKAQKAMNHEVELHKREAARGAVVDPKRSGDRRPGQLSLYYYAELPFLFAVHYSGDAALPTMPKKVKDARQNSSGMFTHVMRVVTPP